MDRLRANANKTPLPAYSPPKPKIADGLRSLLVFLNTGMRTAAMMEGIQRAFVTTGLARDVDGKYVMWQSSAKCASPFEADKTSADVVPAVEVMAGTGIASFEEENADVDVDGLSDIGTDSEPGEDTEEDEE